MRLTSHIWQMEASLKRELQTAGEEKEKFVKEFSEEDYDYIVTGWQVREPWCDLAITQEIDSCTHLCYLSDVNTPLFDYVSGTVSFNESQCVRTMSWML
jgi:hypothetical protein